MTPERWQEIDKLLEQALEQEPEGRGVFLDQACAGDQELRREVESLLAAHEKAGSALSSPPVALTTQKPLDPLQSLIGQRIAHYQILSRLGEGGMGVVYKARDTHLDRFVAIKVLPHELVADPDRKRRFVQEARAASALNHPNIITVHDIANENGRDFIVMEYVAGKTLDRLIPRKGMPLKEALRIAIPMADALAAAHAAGIVHRDLKPGNVMVGDNGRVRVVDFGLAKLIQKERADQGEGTRTETGESRPNTEAGALLGTVSYMSPEQAEGKKLDARSDIFSFGSVFYEIVTGRQAFHGATRLSTLTAILREEPKRAGELVEGLPKEVERIISRCLRKEPGRRFQHMDDVKVELEELKEESDSGKLVTAAVPQRSRSWRPIWIIAALALLTAAALAMWFRRSDSEAPEEAMTSLPLTSYPGYEGHASFSPDGNQVAFEWDGEKQDNQDIYIKLVGSEPPLRLTTHPAPDFSPACSPDGRWIAFLRRLSAKSASVLLVPALGGPERPLSEIEVSDWFGPNEDLGWSADGKGLVLPDRDSAGQGLFFLSVETAEKRRLTSPPAKFLDYHPSVAPDGSTLAFIRFNSSLFGDIYLQQLEKTIAPNGKPKQLTVENQSADSLAWTADGRELILASGRYAHARLWRVAVSGSGKPHPLTWVGEEGSKPAISRQGHRLAYTHALGDKNIWRVGVAGWPHQTSRPTPFISSTRIDYAAQFSPNGKKIVFGSGRSSRPGGYEIWVCNSDGSGAVQLTSLGAESGTPRWSPDGGRIAFDSNVDRQYEIYVISTNGGKSLRLTSNPASDYAPSWSHDGEWVYFASNRSEGHQVWRVHANGGEAVQVTRKGGSIAFESPDGKFVYYTKSDGESSLWKVPVEGGDETEVLTSVASRAFAMAEKGIYFISEPPSGADHFIQFLGLTSGAIKPIAGIGKSWPSYLTVSPDERWFLYSQQDQLGSDLMLVENFR